MCRICAEGTKNPHAKRKYYQKKMHENKEPIEKYLKLDPKGINHNEKGSYIEQCQTKTSE